MFDNGKKIIDILPFTKAAGAGFKAFRFRHVLRYIGGARSAFRLVGGKFVSYAFVAYNISNAVKSIFADDPVKQAEKRGYTLQ